MIIEEQIEIIVNNKLVNHFKSKGYEFYKGGDKITINNIDLPINSGYKIKVECDICGKLYELSMQKYNKNIERGGYLSCKSCNNITYKDSMIKKYGADNPSKIDECNEKRKITCLEKYNSEYICNSEYSKNKTIETDLFRYGGHPMKNEIIKNKVKSTNIERYGVYSSFLVPEIIEKIKQTNLERYGVENVQQNKEIKERTLLTFIERYGRKEFISEWVEYKNKCRYKTNNKRKIIINMWDGYDYYDGEYIKNNFVLNCYDDLYPNIDHKISIFEGFINNLSVDDICNDNNMCITKRKHNNNKHTKSEIVFKEILKNKTEDK